MPRKKPYRSSGKFWLGRGGNYWADLFFVSHLRRRMRDYVDGCFWDGGEICSQAVSKLFPGIKQKLKPGEQVRVKANFQIDEVEG